MWLEASRLARGDCTELENPFPPPTPRARSLQRQQTWFLSIPSLILDKRGQARLYKCLGAGAGAILTRKGIISIELHPSRLMSKIHIWGLGLGAGAGAGGWGSLSLSGRMPPAS